MNQTALTIGCLGTTHPHASARVKALRGIPGVTVCVAADPDVAVDNFATAYDLEVSTVDAIIDDPNVDAVLVHSYSRHMVSLAAAAISAGKHVLVEKPGGSGVDDIAKLVDAEPGIVVQVGYNCRLATSVSKGIAIVRSGEVGELVSVNAHAAARVGEHLAEHLNHPEDMGGGLWVIGCHVLDIVLAACGVPNSLNGHVGKARRLSDTRSREDYASAILKYDEFQAVYDFEVHDPLEWFESSRITFHGTNGLVEIGLLPTTLKYYVAQPPAIAGWHTWRDTQFTVPWAKDEDNEFSELPELSNLTFFRTEAERFVSSIRNQTPVAVTALDSLNLARVIQGIYESSENRGMDVQIGPHASNRSAPPTTKEYTE